MLKYRLTKDTFFHTPDGGTTIFHKGFVFIGEEKDGNITAELLPPYGIIGRQPFVRFHKSSIPETFEIVE